MIGSQFTAQLAGEPNQRYVVQASTDLRSWVAIHTNTTTSAGTFVFSVPTSATRFFRALELP